MSVASLSAEVERKCRDFAWEQWTQIGLSGRPPSVPARWALDPEALILFTLETARADPRLFDELLDWLVLNSQLVSVQRLRNLCLDDDDRRLADAALAWVAQWRPRARLTAGRGAAQETPAPQPLFHELGSPRSGVDPAFADHGYLRPLAEPSHKSQHPDLRAAAAFAFRLRRLLGVGVRAEVLGALLTINAPRVSSGVLNASAGFTRQNVREGLHQLTDAGMVVSTKIGSEQFFAVRHGDWAQLLGLDERELPIHRDWIQTLGPLRLILRWLRDPRTSELSDYMRASEARQLHERVSPDLRFAGVVTGNGTAKGAAYWDEFVESVQGVIAAL